jgi:putative ABC transport system permease protein
VFGVRMLRGRPILAADDARAPRVAVISDALARRQFPGVDPIGRRILVGDPSDAAWLTIVGVMPALYAASVTTANGNHYPPEVVTAFWQRSRAATATIALRTTADADGAAAVRRVMSALDPDAPVYSVTPMHDVLAQQLWPVRVFGTLFVIFGGVALVLAAIGLYAVMAFSVSRRVREMGIRLALGATSGDVIALVCRQGAVQVLIGMTIGLVLGSGAVRAARAALFEVQPGDPAVFALVVSVLGAAAITACLVPAARATRVDPVIALRSE